MEKESITFVRWGNLSNLILDLGQTVVADVAIARQTYMQNFVLLWSLVYSVLFWSLDEQRLTQFTQSITIFTQVRAREAIQLYNHSIRFHSDPT